MRSYKFAVLVVVLMSAADAQAQRRGFGPQDWSKVGPGKVPASKLSNKDLEGVSPVKFLMKKRKALGLSDDQLKQLAVLDEAIKTRNDSLYRQLDSLRKDMRPSTAPPAVEGIRLRGIQRDVVARVELILDSYDAVEPQALAAMSEAQLKLAQELLVKHKQESEEMLSEKLGGRRGG